MIAQRGGHPSDGTPRGSWEPRVPPAPHTRSERIMGLKKSSAAEVQTVVTLLRELGMRLSAMDQREDGMYFRIVANVRTGRETILAARTPERVDDAVVWHASGLIDAYFRRTG